MAVRSRNALRSRLSVPREKRLRASSRRPLWQASNRPYPGTAFVLYEPLKVYNPGSMEELNGQHGRGRSHLMWIASPKDVANAVPFMNPAREKTQLWFAPMKTAEAENFGIHGRLVFAKLGNGFIGFKGTGTHFPTPLHKTPFDFDPQRSPKPLQFRGGMPYEDALLEAENAVEINNAFRACRSRGLDFAKRARLLPTFEPIAILRPLQVPERSRNEGNRTPASGFTRKQKQSVLESKTPVPKYLLRQQAVFVYGCRTPYRVKELGDLGFFHGALVDFVSGLGCDKESRRSVETFVGMFEANGLRLGMHNGELVAYGKGRRRKMPIRLLDARREILRNFINNLGATIMVVHKELQGTFHDEGYTSMHEKDISVAGQLFDLDCVKLHVKDKTALAGLQESDIGKAKDVVGAFAGSLFGEMPYDFRAEAEEAAKQKLIKVIEGG
jgi:hypothetical protein